ncbi:MAG: hypothetical protein BVN28_06615 [Nitrospira sp. ST-bin4]|nr:MAG: hypothetical protein BVN28_06615 [Nitrospira sp. ST-bin4]
MHLASTVLHDAAPAMAGSSRAAPCRGVMQPHGLLLASARAEQHMLTGKQDDSTIVERKRKTSEGAKYPSGIGDSSARLES